MQTCIVLGAGFSKSVAGLPVTTEMFDRFRSVMEEQELLGNKNRVLWGNIIFQFVDDLESEYLRKPHSRATKGGTILNSNYLENFEGLCSFIDLNLAFEVHALSESNGQTADLSGKPLFFNYTTPKLKALRGYIGTYIYLSLINYTPNKSILAAFNSNLLSEVSSIISFNYDLVLEKYLFDKKRWFPNDGYGFKVSGFPEVNPIYQTTISDFEILKMHGSLNWDVNELYHKGVELEWYDDDNSFFFPDYLLDQKKRNFNYQGGVSSGGWLLPSWIKQFKYDELIQVWSKASIAMKNADQIIFIGYSLPSADSAVYALLSTIDFRSKKVVLIDPNAEELYPNYAKILRAQEIEIFPQILEDYLNIK